MAIKKSDLYSSIWASCDELRGGMDASQYKDYVLFMLFIKYITDKYGNSTDFAPPVTIPKGASFKDMLELRGKSDIGDKINTQIIAPLVQANARLARSDFPDFNDSNKLGEGQAKVDRLTNLINIFASPQLDFSQNRAEHDDILGDAYEYSFSRFADRRLLDRLRLSVCRGRKRRCERGDSAITSWRVRKFMRRTRANVRVFLETLLYAGPAVPPELCH
jgi:type I restriction enzyme M protein